MEFLIGRPRAGKARKRESRRGKTLANCNALLRDWRSPDRGSAWGADSGAEFGEIENFTQESGFGIDEAHEITAFSDAWSRRRRLEPRARRVAHVTAVAAELTPIEIGGQPAKAGGIANLGWGEGLKGGVEVGRHLDGDAEGRVGIVDLPGISFPGEPDDVVVPEDGFGGGARLPLLPDRYRAPSVGNEEHAGPFALAQGTTAAMPDVLFAIEGPIVVGGITQG